MHTFQMNEMKFGEVMKQFKSNFLKLPLSDICVKKNGEVMKQFTLNILKLILSDIWVLK